MQVGLSSKELLCCECGDHQGPVQPWIYMLGRANRLGLLIKIQILRCKKFCILSIFILSGCVTIPEVINLKQDESFTHDEIVAGMRGVGGVISIVKFRYKRI
jgi:hypothetical protein